MAKLPEKSCRIIMSVFFQWHIISGIYQSGQTISFQGQTSCWHHGNFFMAFSFSPSGQNQNIFVPVLTVRPSEHSSVKLYSTDTQTLWHVWKVFGWCSQCFTDTEGVWVTFPMFHSHRRCLKIKRLSVWAQMHHLINQIIPGCET